MSNVRAQLVSTLVSLLAEEPGEECLRCRSTMHIPPEFEPTVLCNSCAQWACDLLAAHIRDQIVTQSTQPIVASSWEPPGGLTRAKASLRKRRR